MARILCYEGLFYHFGFKLVRLSCMKSFCPNELDEELKRLQDSPSPPPTSEGVRETEVVVAICFQLHQGISQNTLINWVNGNFRSTSSLPTHGKASALTERITGFKWRLPLISILLVGLSWSSGPRGSVWARPRRWRRWSRRPRVSLMSPVSC